MEERLKKRQHDADPCSFKSDQLLAILSRLVANKSTLIEHANAIDKHIALSDGVTLASLVNARVDFSLPVKLSGKAVAEKLCRSWGVISFILKHGRFSRGELHDLQNYITIMERVETFCKEQLFLESKSTKGDGKTIKLPGDKAARLYLKDGGTKPNPTLVVLMALLMSRKRIRRRGKTMRRSPRSLQQITKFTWRGRTGKVLLLQSTARSWWIGKLQRWWINCLCAIAARITIQMLLVGQSAFSIATTKKQRHNILRENALCVNATAVLSAPQCKLLLEPLLFGSINSHPFNLVIFTVHTHC
jgi:hypothetical protein